jgi:hypothetical protein
MRSVERHEVVEVSEFAGTDEVVFEAESSVLEEVDAILNTFENAARFGYFSVGAGTQAEAIERVAAHRTATVASRRWRVRGLRAGAYRVLLNMLDALRGTEAQVQRLRLLSSSGSGRTLSASALRDAAYPASDGRPRSTSG